MPRTAKMSPQEEHRILARAPHSYADHHLVQVECLRSTMPILKKAGYVNPIAFRRYLVRTEWSQDMPLLRVKP
jgi:hypothetical protein